LWSGDTLDGFEDKARDRRGGDTFEAPSRDARGASKLSCRVMWMAIPFRRATKLSCDMMFKLSAIQI
jgi:hypothetical protein